LVHLRARSLGQRQLARWAETPGWIKVVRTYVRKITAATDRRNSLTLRPVHA